MQFGLEWHIPRRVLVLTVSGDVSLEELAQFNKAMLSHLEQGIPPVHLVSIGDNIRRVPTSIMLIKQTVTYLQHPNMGWTIIVQEKANPLTGFMVSVAAQATGMKMRQVKNASDGLETLARLDHSIAFPVSSV
ncbi:MAG: hypothetical protein H0X30_37340 [Anaerolineae bacterium]|nr:hypothetical protein [Anaerolineae bacterium]